MSQLLFVHLAKTGGTSVRRILKVLARKLEFDLDEPFEELPEKAREAILFGSDEPLRIEVVRRRANSRRESASAPASTTTATAASTRVSRRDP